MGRIIGYLVFGRSVVGNAKQSKIRVSRGALSFLIAALSNKKEERTRLNGQTMEIRT